MKVSYDSTDVREFFRIYFNAMSLLVGFLGSLCSSNQVKFDLMYRKKVKLTRMGGWFNSADIFTSMWLIWGLPGGWLAWFMMLSFLLHLTSDFATSTIIQVRVQGRCHFGTGLITLSGTDLAPAADGAPYFVVAQAQSTSQSNGGLKGVYVKANRNLNFSAAPVDVLGGWQCSPNPTALTFSPDVYFKDVVQSVVDHGLMYDLPDPPYAVAERPISFQEVLSSHLIIWDTSAGNNFGVPFDVRIAVDISAKWTDVKVVESFECKLQYSQGHRETLLNIQRNIMSRQTLTDWTIVLDAAVYNGYQTPAAHDTQGKLEEVLNSMMMVSGGQNVLLNSPGPDADPTQGCIRYRTEIPWEVLALAGAFAALAILLLVTGLVYKFLIYRAGRRAQGSVEEERYKWIKENAPSVVWMWMMQAIRESGKDKEGEMDKKPMKKRKRTKLKMKMKKFGALKHWEIGDMEGSVQPEVRKISAGTVADKPARGTESVQILEENTVGNDTQERREGAPPNAGNIEAQNDVEGEENKPHRA